MVCYCWQAYRNQPLIQQFVRSNFHRIKDKEGTLETQPLLALMMNLSIGVRVPSDLGGGGGAVPFCPKKLRMPECVIIENRVQTYSRKMT